MGHYHRWDLVNGEVVTNLDIKEEHLVSEKAKKEAWVLRLKDDSKENYMTGDYYLDDDGEEFDFLTQDLNKATVFDNKERAIKNFKLYEQAIFEKFGSNAICNFGYTNIMKNFDFVEVEIKTV